MALVFDGTAVVADVKPMREGEGSFVTVEFMGGSLNLMHDGSFDVRIGDDATKYGVTVGKSKSGSTFFKLRLRD